MSRDIDDLRHPEWTGDTLDLDALSALREAATPEPWALMCDGTIEHNGIVFAGWPNDVGEPLDPNDRYIVALVNAAPTLIATIRERDAELVALREVAEAAKRPVDLWRSRRDQGYAIQDALKALSAALANLKGAHHAD